MPAPVPVLPPPVEAVTARWLALVDAARPGLVTGLHLRGGLCFGEWVEGQSDVDFVAVLARRPDPGDVEALVRAHAALREACPSPSFDGMHVLAADLAGDPEDCPDVLCVLGGHVEVEGREDLNLVAWTELATRGVTVRGTPVDELGVWTDDARLRAFTRENLDSYWRATAEGLAAAVTSSTPAEAGREDVCRWCVLGVARLDHLLVTGALTTKSGAGRWALGHHPARFGRVVAEALRLRDGGEPRYPATPEGVLERGRDVAAFTAYVVAAGTA